MLNTNMIRNIKEVEEIKIELLENITILFKGIENSDTSIKDVLIRNMELNEKLAEKLGINIENRRI